MGKSDLFSPLFFLNPLRKRKEKADVSPQSLNLELKMHTRNIHTHIYTRTNFQAHFDRDTEDMCARVITKLSLISCFLGVFFERRQVFVTKKRTHLYDDGA